MDQSWIEKLTEQLTKDFGEHQGSELAAKYARAFPISYVDETKIDACVNDIRFLERLIPESPIELKLYVSNDAAEFPLHIRIYQHSKPIPLSTTILPMLANFNLTTYTERTDKVTLASGELHWISDFAIAYNDAELDIARVSHLFTDAFLSIYAGRAENDGFNKLVLGAGLTWHEIIILRAYAKYLHQIGFRFTQHYIEQTLSLHPEITKDLIRLFKSHA